MMKAIAILSGLVGYTMAIKVLSIIKMLGIEYEMMEKVDYEELLKDPKFMKYMR